MSLNSHTHRYANFASFSKRHTTANAGQGMTPLPATDATGHSILPGKKETFMIKLPVNRVAAISDTELQLRFISQSVLFHPRCHIFSKILLHCCKYLRRCKVRDRFRFFTMLRIYVRDFRSNVLQPFDLGDFRCRTFPKLHSIGVVADSDTALQLQNTGK